MLVGIQAGHLSLEGKQVWPQEDSADACARGLPKDGRLSLPFGVTIVTFNKTRGGKRPRPSRLNDRLSQSC